MPLRKLPILASLVLLGLWAIAFTATHWPIPHPADKALFPHVDKVAHALIYGTLAIAAAFAVRSWGFRWSPLLAVAIALGMIALGIFDEMTQMFVVGRTPDPTDLLADAVGIVLGLGFFTLLRGKLPRPKASAGDSP